MLIYKLPRTKVRGIPRAEEFDSLPILHRDRNKIEKPKFKKISSYLSIMRDYSENRDKYQSFIRNINEPKYLYWDEAKYKPIPPKLTPVKFWWLVKLIRRLSCKKTIIQTENNKNFSWLRLDYTDEALNKIDMHTGGQIFVPYEAISLPNKQKFVARGILEEAIASSQLEGAHTTRKAAKNLILQNRKPRDHSELMIINNYKTMEMIEKDFKDRPLSKELLFELHANLTKDDLPKSEQNRFRKNSDKRIIHNNKEIALVPPKEKFVREQIERLLAYANDQLDPKFQHPIIKAIFLHFWVCYLHPFTDGNGRLARSLFYWYLLRKEYWTMMYLPISSVIKKSRIQYDKAFIYSEQDDLDITYFYDYHMRKILQAIDEFADYLQKVVIENKEVEVILEKEIRLNERQKQIIHYLLSEGEGAYTTVTANATVNNIGRISSAKDLKRLKEKGYLEAEKVGRFVRYYASEKLKSLSK